MCTALMSDPPDTSVCDDPEVDIYGKTGVNLANFVWVAQRLSKGVIFTHAAGPNKGKVGKRMSPIEMRAAQENDFSSVATGNEGFDNDQSIPIESRDTDIEFEDWDNEDWEALNEGFE
ncbi:uncharacterized protein N7484_002098 [Penicillium longicatenatum]|uniref:uncharacterized protein n=1 Tax=Penicillium longicatenatum TaxID=1561947 RepID=UPI002548A197|nr:uncharacterized protein N7484_002098 [Penicillium longicatenatum]KAJ5658449.1 hypothetical protein N7484_002098 [Penicillium longicatenatum]